MKTPEVVLIICSMSPLVDSHGRVKRKLRISVTDRCNFHCLYCMPMEPVWKMREEILTFEEIVFLARILVRYLGIQMIRLTGGEPLMRKGLCELIGKLAELKGMGLKRLSLTTNGFLLEALAVAMKGSGLDDINVSLDALNPEVFCKVTRGGILARVLRGIRRAQEAGLRVKINTVVVRGLNEQEIFPLVRWATREGLTLRFIEFMPLDGRGFWMPERVFPQSEILKALKKIYHVIPLECDPSTPARYFLLDGKVKVGIISTVSEPFCDFCDRIRVTADGRLFPCLFSRRGWDLKTPLREGGDEGVLSCLVKKGVSEKPRGFIELKGPLANHSAMYVLGG